MKYITDFITTDEINKLQTNTTIHGYRLTQSSHIISVNVLLSLTKWEILIFCLRHGLTTVKEGKIHTYISQMKICKIFIYIIYSHWKNERWSNKHDDIFLKLWILNTNQQTWKTAAPLLRQSQRLCNPCFGTISKLFISTDWPRILCRLDVLL
jgi:hypothetical protein